MKRFVVLYGFWKRSLGFAGDRRLAPHSTAGVDPLGKRNPDTGGDLKDISIEVEEYPDRVEDLLAIAPASACE